MANDEDEQLDVKAKVAQLSGSKIRQKRGERLAKATRASQARAEEERLAQKPEQTFETPPPPPRRYPT